MLKPFGSLPPYSFVVRSATLVVSLVLCVLGLAVVVSAQTQKFVSFDAPGASSYGTVPADMNAEGTITGYYWDANYVGHGFVRYADGKITTFDVPGAGTTPNDQNGTFPTGINQFGVVAGYMNDNNYVSHCFIRTPDGKITVFDIPGADLNPADGEGSLIIGINDLGATSGFLIDTNFLYHGFLRTPDGKVATFEAHGSGGYGTIPDGPLNLEGAIVGYFTDANFVWHSFVRWPNGQIVGYVPPGACESNTTVAPYCLGNGAYNINISGTSVGAYVDNSANYVAHGFLRSADGTITGFEIPGAGTGLNQGFTWNQVAGLNDFGGVTAGYLDANNVFHGFLRSQDGKFTSFDAPGADLTPGNYNGTFPASINNSGVIAGYYTDVNYVQHGFVRLP